MYNVQKYCHIDVYYLVLKGWEGRRGGESSNLEKRFIKIDFTKMPPILVLNIMLLRLGLRLESELGLKLELNLMFMLGFGLMLRMEFMLGWG